MCLLVSLRFKGAVDRFLRHKRKQVVEIIILRVNG